MSTFQHTVSTADTAQSTGSGELEVLATARLIGWCERAAYEVCRRSTGPDKTTVGTFVKIEQSKGSPLGAEVTVSCADPINDGRRLVCFVRATDGHGDTLAEGEIHRAVVDPDRFMSKCRHTA